MKIFKCLLIFSCLLFQAENCLAQDIINISFIYNTPIICSQPLFDVAVTQQSILGISPGSCTADRPSNPASGAGSNISNQFNRMMGVWRYSPNGVFKDGFYFALTAGIENDSFNSTAGSTAEVYFAGYGLMSGYQWFWKNGFNITWIFSVAHLEQISLNNYNIVPGERADVINWLQTNTSSNTHFTMGPLLGWSF